MNNKNINPQNPTQEFIMANYQFRRNIISGKTEFRACSTNKEEPQEEFRVFTVEDLNSLILAAKEALPDRKGVRDEVKTVVKSRLVADYDPIAAWLDECPEWDGKNHVDALLNRLPGLSAEERYWMHLWMRSMVAHWMQKDSLHGNEVVPTFIGRQGCGKTTFCRRLLPEELRVYFLDHVNLANKFDKEMALTNNLLVNIDELDQVRRSQQAELKQLLSKSRVNGRPIYGQSQEDRLRYASFVATTNNRHPLHDPTGSRRFLCIEIPEGQVIDNETPIDYRQLYAQLKGEVERGERYWFSDEEVAALQRANAQYQSTVDLERIVCDVFRHPRSDEPCRPMTMSEVIEYIQCDYSFVQPTRSMKIQLGLALAAQGFESKREAAGYSYFVVPRR